MRSLHPIRRDLSLAIGKAVLALFALPLLALWFSTHVLEQNDKVFLAYVAEQMQQDSTISSDQMVKSKAFFRENPPSAMCGSAGDAHPAYRDDVCARYSDQWQFYWMSVVSKVMLVVGAVILSMVVALGAMSFLGRGAQYASVNLAWRLLSWPSAIEVTVQGAMVVWLSFWLTAWFFEIYFVKLIIVAAIVAFAAVSHAVVQILKRSNEPWFLTGELLTEENAPALWERVRALAEQMKTEPPAQIVAGIDANFFVTEAPLHVGPQALTGRTLYVSLPLLRVLDQAEADAVLVHELAHFSGGDATSGAALAPRLHQFDNYCYSMYGATLAMVAFCIMNAYRLILEVALKKDSREREFRADRFAAMIVSGKDLIHGLVKVTAYSAYRSSIEQELFEQNQQHTDSLGIALHVAKGLRSYAYSSDFQYQVAMSNLPHPFDSHPGIGERMDNVAYHLDEQHYGKVVGAAVAKSWASELPTAKDIEALLWRAYEQDFSTAHEESLAWRYWPRDDAERAIVLKYFPLQKFVLRSGILMVSYEDISLPKGDTISWEQVENIGYEEGFGGDVLTITQDKYRAIGKPVVKVKLPGVKNDRERLKAVLGQYWNRHRSSRQA